MNLIDTIRETIYLAEDGKIPYEDFDVIYQKLVVAADLESAPLLANGQKVHAQQLKDLLAGLLTLKPLPKIPRLS